MGVSVSRGRWWRLGAGATVVGAVVVAPVVALVVARRETDPVTSPAGVTAATGELRPGPVLQGGRVAAGTPSAATGRSTSDLIAIVAAAAPGEAQEEIDDLLSRLGRRTLTPEELLALALVTGEDGRRSSLAQRAEQRLREVGFAAGDLLGRLLDLLEGDDMHARGVAARLVGAVAGAGADGHADGGGVEEIAPEARERVVPFFARIQALVAGASADELHVRLAMLPLLEVLGPRAAAAAPALVAWIQDVYREREAFAASAPEIHVSWDHYEFRIQRTLSSLGAAALPAILEALRGGDAQASWLLHEAIQELGPDALPALRELASDPSAQLRASAFTARMRLLGGRPEALELAREGLRDPAPRVRVAALEALRALGPAAAAELVAALADPEAEVRRVALAGLEHVPEAARAQRPRLLELMRTGSYGERLGAMGVLARLGAEGAEATPYVLDLLGSGPDRLRDDDVAFGMFRDALRGFGPAALPWVVEAAGGEAGPRRSAALHVLVTWPGLEAHDVRVLGEALPQVEGLARLELARVLARVGRLDGVAVLAEALQDPDLSSRVAAATGLQQAGALGAQALPRLVEGLRTHERRLHAEGAAWHEEWAPYYAYYLAVEQVGQHAPERMAALLADPDAEVRAVASNALALAGEAGARAIESAWPTLDAVARAQAVAGLLSRSAPPPRSEVASRRLRAALEDPSPGVRLTAARGLLGDATLPDAVPVLIGLLAVPEGTIAQDAAWELRKLGASLAPFEAALRAALPPAGSTARAWVQEALDALRAR